MNKKFLIIFFIFLVAAAFIFFLKERDLTNLSNKLDSKVQDALKPFGINDSNLSRELHEKTKYGRAEVDHVYKEYYLGEKVSIKDLKDAFTKALKKTKFRILKSDYVKSGNKEALNLEFYFKKYNILTLKFTKKIFREIAIPKEVPRGARGKVAIVLDDFGYSLRNLDNLSKINHPLTFSILPNLAYSKKVAIWAKEHNFETILHLPLEPYEDKEHLEKNTIMCSMNDGKIKSIFEDDLKSVPGIKGVSNHMGSKATEDERVMKVIFNKMKNNGLFFLDSLATAKSVCRELAGRIKIEYAQRDIFLDNVANGEYIKSQLKKLSVRAKEKGYAVGIGHDRPVTIEALIKNMPEMASDGIDFIFLSEIEERK